jgi:hypothetical protein
MSLEDKEKLIHKEKDLIVREQLQKILTNNPNMHGSIDHWTKLFYFSIVLKNNKLKDLDIDNTAEFFNGKNIYAS